MLVKDRSERLGQNNDMDEILMHPFFADLNVDSLLKKKVVAPFIPTVKGVRDL